MITEEKKNSKSHIELISEHLIKYGSISSIEAIDLYGCTRLSARIADLRKRGWPITSDMATAKNRYGHTTNYAVYRMGG